MKVLLYKSKKYPENNANTFYRETASDRSVFSKVIILALSNLALQVIWFFYRSMLTRLAGSETLGLQSLVMQVYSIIVSV